jgi:hypothetical protein
MFLTSMQRNFFVLTLALALALPFALLLFAGKAGTPEEALSAREAVFRYQLTHNEFVGKDVVDTFCVEITKASDTFASSRSDPPQEMVERLNDGRHKVRKGSDCDYNKGNGVVEKDSNNPALVLRAGEISWKSGTRVAITGGFYYASESGSGNVYYLEKRDGKWFVIKDKLIWIS